MNDLSKIILLIITSISLADIDETIVSNNCMNPKACIDKLLTVEFDEKSSNRYPSLAQQAIINKLMQFQEQAIPLVVELLNHKNDQVAQLAGRILRDVDYIDSKFLPQIIEGINNGNGWLPPALARIGTPKAADYAVKFFLTSKSSPNNQEAFAINLFGKKALPSIIKAAKCEYKCDEDTYYLLGHVLGEMNEIERKFAAKSLIDVAEDHSLNLSVRSGVLSMIGFLDKAGLIVEEKLMNLKANSHELNLAINDALIGIKSKHSGQIFLDILNEYGPDEYILQDIAELGENAHQTGSEIVEYLNHTDMEVKLYATRTLGYIGYKPAIKDLIKELDDTHDVQLNFVTVGSLGMLKANEAIKPLKKVAKNHWYPPVRDAAKTAIEHIKSGKNYEIKYPHLNFAMNYRSFQHFGFEACEEITLKHVSEPNDQKLYTKSDAEKLATLAYDSVILSYGADDEEQQLAEDPNGIIEVNANNMVEHREVIKEIPQKALRVENGWLAGTNRGEWGGELVYIPDTGKTEIIIDKNIEDVYQLGKRHIATTGLSHLIMNEGMIYQLTKNEKDHWEANEWLRLPGSPYSSWFVETGELLINTSGGGSILLSENGGFRMATCK